MEQKANDESGGSYEAGLATRLGATLDNPPTCCATLPTSAQREKEAAALTDEQRQVSMLPLRLDTGEVTVCESLSGRADQAANMPRRLALKRWHPDGSMSRADYAVDPAVFADQQQHLNASEAVMGFAAWLTSRRKAVTWSENHSATEAADCATEFARVNGLPEIRDDFADRLTHPPEPELTGVDPDATV